MIQNQLFVSLIFFSLCSCQFRGPGPEFVELEKSKFMESGSPVEKIVTPPLTPKREFKYNLVDLTTLQSWMTSNSILVVFFEEDERFILLDGSEEEKREVQGFADLRKEFKKDDFVIFSGAKEKRQAIIELMDKAHRVGYHHLYLLDGGRASWLALNKAEPKE